MLGPCFTMEIKRKFPSSLFFETDQYNFFLEWVSVQQLVIEAFKKTEANQCQCYRGELKGDITGISRIYQFLEKHQAINTYQKKIIPRSIITIIDQTIHKKGYSCRILMIDTLKTISVERSIVDMKYLILKKLEVLQSEKKEEKVLNFQMQQELTNKIMETDLNMKAAFQQNMSVIVQSLNKLIQQKLEVERTPKPIHDEQEEQTRDINIKKIKKKLKKKIKKQLKKQMKQKKRAKRHRRKEKRKKRKLKKSNEYLNGQANQQIDLDPQIKQVEIRQSNSPIILKEHDVEINNLNQPPIEINDQQQPNDLIFTHQEIEHKKKKKKNRNREKVIEQPLVYPQNANLLNISKLRNRGGQAPRQIDAVYREVIAEDGQIVTKYKKQNKQKKSKEKGKKSKDPANKNNQQQLIEQQGEKEYYRRLQQLRKNGDIEEVRITKASRSKPILAKPKAPVEDDEFNPKYNGQPKYKPFVGINEYQPLRPGQIFVNRLEQVSTTSKKIPAIFREQVPSYKNFDVSGNVVRKKNGYNYQQMVFDYPVPQTGVHVLTMRIIQSKRLYIWFGVIDLREKDREQSYNKKSTITFSFRTGHIATSNKWSTNKLGRLSAGLTVRMEINMDKGSITWYISDGRTNIAPIPKLLRKLTLVPYFQMMDIDDQICFED